MLRSMFSGVSGLKMHQTRMDVIGNNIANVNTVAFKGSTVTFQEIYSQTLKPASAPIDGATGRGGTNPFQVGLGVSIASINVLHLNGSAQRTDKVTDLAIEGDGFFVVTDGTNRQFTRAGNFDIDRGGNIVTANGLKLQGWSYNPITLRVDTSGEPQAINLANLVLPPKATENVKFEGNLDNRVEDGTSIPYTVSIYDAKGTEHKLTYTFTKNADNAWSYTVTAPVPLNVTSGESGSISFDNNGQYNDINTVTPSMTIEIPGADTLEIQPSFTLDKFTQYAGETSVKAVGVDGHRMGALNGINIDGNGNVIGIYSNGQFRVEASLAIAKFTNPGGLDRLGNNLFNETTNSGLSELGLSGQDGRGVINPGALEMSNVDLAKEFTDMIATQRGFQANSRIITTSDEMLQELVNLKR